MRTKFLAILLLAGSSLFARVHVSIGVGVGGPGYYLPPPPPARIVTYVPPRPGPGYVWIRGYWRPMRGQYYWHAGYWSRRPYVRAYWVAPHYYHHRYYRGYWVRR